MYLEQIPILGQAPLPVEAAGQESIPLALREQLYMNQPGPNRRTWHYFLSNREYEVFSSRLPFLQRSNRIAFDRAMKARAIYFRLAPFFVPLEAAAAQTSFQVENGEFVLKTSTQTFLQIFSGAVKQEVLNHIRDAAADRAGTLIMGKAFGTALGKLLGPGLDLINVMRSIQAENVQRRCGRANPDEQCFRIILSLLMDVPASIIARKRREPAAAVKVRLFRLWERYRAARDEFSRYQVMDQRLDPSPKPRPQAVIRAY